MKSFSDRNAFLIFYFYSGWAFSGLLMDRGKKNSLPKICHTYPTMMKPSIVIFYLKKIQKISESPDTILTFWWHPHFFTGNQILICQEIQIYIAFWYIISNSFNFFQSLKFVLITTVRMFMISAIMATLGLLKIKTFYKKGYEVIISDQYVTNKNLSRDSN